MTYKKNEVKKPKAKAALRAFKEKFYPEICDQDWGDWRWQLRNRIRDLEGIKRILQLSVDEEQAILKRQGMLPLGLTPYYAALLDPLDSCQGLRRTKIPSMLEFEVEPGEREDPLGEEDHSPLPGIIHTYPDKVLFLVTDFCATYCRYCTRSRMVGGGEFLPDSRMWDAAIEYIREHTEIRDVLLSGGDPLILSDEKLKSILDKLSAIPHVEILRIGTKVPMVLPQRITQKFCKMLQAYHPLYFSIHVIHPDELTAEAMAACEMLADHGFPLGGQSVLLKGVNDDPEVMKELNQRLLQCRVKPYYLHQCDPVSGSSHFKTTVQQGLDILQSLTGNTTGYAVPQYMIDAPGGGGKVPVSPNYVERDGDWLKLQNFRGEKYRYYDPESG